MLDLEFKQCKSNIGMYYFIDKETRELIITIVYVFLWVQKIFYFF